MDFHAQLGPEISKAWIRIRIRFSKDWISDPVSEQAQRKIPVITRKLPVKSYTCRTSIWVRVLIVDIALS